MYKNNKIGIVISVIVTAIAIGSVVGIGATQDGSMQQQGQAIIDRTANEIEEIPETMEDLASDVATTTEERISDVIEESNEIVTDSDSVSELADNTADSIKDILPDVPKVVSQDDGKLLELVSIPVNTSVPGCEETDTCYAPYSAVMLAGGEVIWTNNDAIAHTVTSGTPQKGPNGLFDSGLIMPGDTYSVKLDLPFDYDYFCMVHPWMQGTIAVN